MNIIVLKFGGVAVRDYPEQVIRYILQYQKEGYGIVAVVSAEAGVTDSLIKRAKELSCNPEPRALDFLVSTGEQIAAGLIAIRLQEKGCDAIPLTGWQAGIITSGLHGNAEIKGLNLESITACLKSGKVVIVTGFQGVTPENTITTLGRGGSDYTAKYLELALRAEMLVLFKEVDGIMSADPGRVPEAIQRASVTPRELLELVNGGAKVVNQDSARLMTQGGRALIRSVVRDVPGTLVVPTRPQKTRGSITGIASSHAIQFSLSNTRADRASELFGALGKDRVSVDIVHVSAGEHLILFTTNEKTLPQTRSVTQTFVEAYGGSISKQKIAVVRMVGEELQSATGVVGEILSTLEEIGISNPLTPTSEITISVVVPEHREEEVIRLLHKRLIEEKEL